MEVGVKALILDVLVNTLFTLAKHLLIVNVNTTVRVMFNNTIKIFVH